MSVNILILAVVVLGVVALAAIEAYCVRRGIPTISERLQRLNAAMGTQLVAGVFFLLGAVAGFLVCHFASVPPA